MKKLYLLPLLLVSIMITTLSCEKESIAISDLSAEEQYERLTKPQVLYQFSALDLTSGEESGWIIDQAGAVRPYHRIVNPNLYTAGHESWSASSVAWLATQADASVRTIPVEEMLERFRQSRSLQESSLSAPERNEGASFAYAFHAFDYRAAAGSSHDDNECNRYGQSNTTYQTTTEVRRILIHLSGRDNRELTAPKGLELQEWLRGIGEGI